MTLRDDSRWSPQKGAEAHARLPLFTADQLTQEWRHRAACRGQDDDLFFPVGEGRLASAQTEEAKDICGTCPVRSDCLQFALDLDITDGVWGGLSERQRRALKRRRSRSTT